MTRRCSLCADKSTQVNSTHGDAGWFLPFPCFYVSIVSEMGDGNAEIQL